ncbi:MAG TPA: ABC transporter substrate-binding protein [Burkholderiales bacterium]|nr:ABC transporter substrate-binding protein [Burkholderiales bacterium]
MKRIAPCLLVAAGFFSPASFAENGVSADTIVLGQSVALTGPAAALGTEMRNGAKVYFDYVNASGGVSGRKIRLITLDDGYEPSRTVPNTKRLIEQDKVFALFGYVGTPTSAAALPIFTQAKVPFFGAFTGAELLRQPVNHYIFNVRASYYDETEKIVEQLVSTGSKNIAVFYQDDAYGQAGLKGVELAMERRNLKISATGIFERNTVKVERAVKTLNAAQPDAVVMIGAYKACAEFIRQMKKQGSAAQFYNVSFVGSKALADDLGGQGVGVAISQVMPFPWGAAVPVVREYQGLMRRAGHKELTFTTIEGFIAAKVFVEALRRTGRELTRERLIATLERMNDVDVGGFYVGFSPTNHSASKFVDLTIIARDGKFLR